VSWLEFITQLSDALAWPLVALIAVIFLGPEIKQAAKGLVGRIGDISHLKAPGVAIDFEEARELAASTEHLKEDNEEAEPTSRESTEIVLPTEVIEERFSQYSQTAGIVPKAAVMLSFSDLETYIRNEFGRRHPNESPKLSFARITSILQREGVLDADAVGSLTELRTLRNRVTHEGAEVDSKTAVYYVQSVTNLFSYLTSTGFFKNPLS
jgi:hypothetical protein